VNHRYRSTGGGGVNHRYGSSWGGVNHRYGSSRCGGGRGRGREWERKGIQEINRKETCCLYLSVAYIQHHQLSSHLLGGSCVTCHFLKSLYN